MKIPHYWNPGNLYLLGLNYSHDESSIVEFMIRLPLFFKRYSKWKCLESHKYCKGIKMLCIQFYFRIRPKKIKDWKVPLNYRIILDVQTMFV